MQDAGVQSDDIHAPTKVRNEHADGARPDYEIVVVGAGLSGVGMGVQLLEHGYTDFVILERAGEVGGVWRDNTYPGVGVDIPSHAYQFDYLPGEWSRAFGKGHEVKAYIERVADQFDVRKHIRFNAEVAQRSWNEAENQWNLSVGTEVVTARWVINAIGNFPMPKDPKIPGLDSFSGTILRSASWDHDCDLVGKRIGVIGTGASGVQLIPELAKIAGHLHVYQRTPIWVTPKPDPAFGRRTQRFFERFPAAERALSLALTRAMALLIAGWVEFEKPNVRRLLHAVTWLLRERFFRRCVPDAELRRKLTPQYGFMCKRPSLSSAYLRTFNRPNVELITTSIDRVTPAGIKTADGDERALDALVLATGFHNAHDPEPYRVSPIRGVDDFDLATYFAEERIECYEGVSIPGLPNNVFIAGPYSATGGTWHDIVKVSATHAIRLLDEAHRRNATRVEVRREAATRWTRMAREKLSRSLFHLNSCEASNSYYFDRHGDTPFLRPSSFADCVSAHETFPFDDYLWGASPADGQSSRAQEAFHAEIPASQEN